MLFHIANRRWHSPSTIPKGEHRHPRRKVHTAFLCSSSTCQLYHRITRQRKEDTLAFYEAIELYPERGHGGRVGTR